MVATRIIEVDMRVDKAGEQDKSGGIDFDFSRRGRLRLNGGDGLPVNDDISDGGTLRPHDQRLADHRGDATHAVSQSLIKRAVAAIAAVRSSNSMASSGW